MNDKTLEERSEEWNEASGVFARESSHYYEMLSFLADAKLEVVEELRDWIANGEDFEQQEYIHLSIIDDKLYELKSSIEKK